MYPNLEAELARKGWSKKKLSEILGKRYYTVIDKLNGKYPLTSVSYTHLTLQTSHPV